MNRKAMAVEFIKLKISETEKSIKVRVAMERVWRSGTNGSWLQASMLHPSTKGKPMRTSARLKQADSNRRIADIMRRELDMFKDVLEELTSR
jgi:hypothetical protein